MSDKSPYNAIIFDLGGVILNLDYGLAEQGFAALGIADVPRLYKEAVELFDAFEVGACSPEEFRAGIRKKSGLDLSDQQLDQAWNRMLLDLPLERLEVVKRLGSKFRLFLLSNTNAIHIAEFERYVEEIYGIEPFKALFEEVYYSHELQLRKPTAAVFEAVLERNDLVPAETIFIDDSPQHIDGAKKLGIHTYHHQRNGRLEDFEEYVLSL